MEAEPLELEDGEVVDDEVSYVFISRFDRSLTSEKKKKQKKLIEQRRHVLPAEIRTTIMFIAEKIV